MVEWFPALILGGCMIAAAALIANALREVLKVASPPAAVQTSTESGAAPPLFPLPPTPPTGNDAESRHVRWEIAMRPDTSLGTITRRTLDQLEQLIVTARKLAHTAATVRFSPAEGPLRESAVYQAMYVMAREIDAQRAVLRIGMQGVGASSFTGRLFDFADAFESLHKPAASLNTGPFHTAMHFEGLLLPDDLHAFALSVADQYDDWTRIGPLRQALHAPDLHRETSAWLSAEVVRQRAEEEWHRRIYRRLANDQGTANDEDNIVELLLGGSGSLASAACPPALRHAINIVGTTRAGDAYLATLPDHHELTRKFHWSPQLLRAWDRALACIAERDAVPGDAGTDAAALGVFLRQKEARDA